MRNGVMNGALCGPAATDTGWQRGECGRGEDTAHPPSVERSGSAAAVCTMLELKGTAAQKEMLAMSMMTTIEWEAMITM